MKSPLLRLLPNCWHPRPPDEVIHVDGSVYLRRWWLLPRTGQLNLYLHHFVRGDRERELHDHPWPNLSVVLRGHYIEYVPDWEAAASPHMNPYHLRKRALVRGPGSIVLRRATDAHRIDLIEQEDGTHGDAWTLFITGPNVRRWGFFCEGGWTHWKQHLAQQGCGTREGPDYA